MAIRRLARWGLAARLSTVIATVAILVWFPSGAEAQSTIAFVQGNYAVPQTPQASVSVPFSAVQTAGNLNVVIVGWNNTSSAITSVTDTKGNVYALAIGPTVQAGNASQSIYFAKNIVGAAAASNTVTVLFTTAANYPDIRILEYRGLDPAAPLHASVGASGSSATSSSGSLTTSAASVLLVAGNVVGTATSGPGSGFTNRMITNPDGDIAQDRIVAAAGTYSATAPLTRTGYWVMQLVAFKASTGPDTTAPTVSITAPTGGPTFVTNTSPITLAGTAADNVGVTQVSWANDRGGGGTAGGTTSWSAPGIALQPGANILTVTARDAAGNPGTAMLTVTYDPTPPTVNITAPTAASTFTTNTSPLALGGSAADDIGVTQVSWANDRGGGGTASGTTSWSTPGIVLQPGVNVLTVTARDAASNAAAATLTVTYTAPDTTGPTVSITAPTAAATYVTNATSLNLGGTAADNVGVTQVSWSNDRGGSGTAVGTTSWSVTGIALQPGANVLTVTARDAVNNPGTATLTVTHDPTAPTVVITSPTSAATFSTNANPLTLGGTATDNVGVTQVSWANNRGGSGVATGTASWSATGIGLQAGVNVLTVTARDAAANTGSVTLTVTYTAPSGLVAAYGFNETSGTTASDSSGIGNHATLVNGALFAAGKNGNAVSLDGVNDYVNIGSPSSLQITGSLTISAWINSSAFPSNDAAVVSKRGNSVAGYQLDTTKDKGSRTIGFKLTNSSGASMSRYGASTLVVNQWYHIAGVYDATARTLNVYLNGQLNNGTLAGTITATQQNSTLAAVIGRKSGNTGFEFAGKIDDARIYNRALTQAEIQADMNAPIGGAPPPDTVVPTVAITAPTTAATFTTSTSPLTLGGSAADNIGVTQVTWTNDRGGSGTAAGTTSWSAPGIALQPGTNVLTVTARDAANNVGSATLTVTYAVPDTAPPTVSITTPTSAATYVTGLSSLTLGGTAADNVGITQVAWSNDRGGSGTAAGTTSWSAAGIALQPGANVLTVTARDAANNPGTAVVTVTYDPVPPTVAITAPTTAATFTTNSSPLTLGGSATDNIAVTQVAWANDRGGSGPASGTTSWSAPGIVLQPGVNVLTVTARDGVNNPGATTLTVTYTVPDTASPTIAITSPTSGPTYITSLSALTLGGTAADNVAVTQVAWTNDRGGSGVAGGTTSWSAPDIALQPGANVLTVTASDAAGNPPGSAVLTVTYDPTAPTVNLSAPAAGATVSGATAVTAIASDNIGVVGVQFLLDGSPLGVEQSGPVFSVSWDSGAVPNGAHTLSARARDAAGNTTLAVQVPVTVSNTQASGPGLLRGNPANPRYFIDGTGKARLLTGSHTWNSFQDIDQSATPAAFDFAAYVAFLKAHGHNATILWRKDLPTACNWGAGPGTYQATQFPWPRTGPGNASDGKPKFDLAQFDQTFFDRLRDRVILLQQNGIYAIVQLFDGLSLINYRCATDGYPFSAGNNVNGISDDGGAGSMTMTSTDAITDIQDAFVRKAIDTVNDLDNVLWEISEEAPPTSTFWQNHMIALIHTYEAGKPLQHPVGYPTLSIGAGTDATLYNSDADWVAPQVRISPTSSCGSGVPTCKVNINDSDHSYFGIWNDSAQTNRNYIWENFTNGNQVLFMDPYVIYWPTGNRNLCGNPVNGVCSSPDPRWNNLRDNLGYTLAYADRMNLVAMSPRPELSSTGQVLANAAANGAEYLVYTRFGGSAFTVNLSATTQVLDVEWLNPSTGEKTIGGTVTGGSTAQSFTPPFSGDAVLYLRQTGSTPDSQNPTVAITVPTSAGGYTTGVSPLTLGGTAGDNVGVVQVSWSNDRGGSGTAAGTTSWSAAGIVLQPGPNVLTVTATDAAGNPGAAVLTVTYDPIPPTVTITAPTDAATFTTATTPLTLGGTAADDVGVMQVTWVNDRGGSGTASGTTSWSAAGIALQPGVNVLTVTARDAANNPGTAALTITYTAPDTTPPTIAITSPTAAATYGTSVSPLTLGGTAGDNVGVTQVTWANDRGGSGTASGTANWSAPGIVLQPGVNVLTVTARDAANNPITATLTVSYDPTPPAVSVTAPTANQTVNGTVIVSATASDNIGVAGVQFLLDGAPLGSEQPGPSFSLSWNTTASTNGAHTLSARARDAAGNTTLAANIPVLVSNQLGLVAAYGFNETSGTTASDSSGTGNHATLLNGAVFAAGRSGNAVSLDGINDYVNIGTPASLQINGSLTISAWIYSSTFPVDDAAVVSKRGNSVAGYQLDTTKDRGPRTIGFKLTNSSGAGMSRYGSSTLALSQWYHIAGVYNATAATLNVYLNSQLDNGTLVGTITATQQNSSLGVVIGRKSGNTGFEFAGKIDDVRIYNRALSQAEIQADMNTPIGGGAPPPPDTSPPTVAITAPGAGSTVFNTITVSANAADNVGVAGVQFFVDGAPLGAEVTSSPYSRSWDTTTSATGSHVLTARARDAAGNATTSSGVSVTVASGTQQFIGQWAGPFTWPLVAIHASLLSTGQVLMWDIETSGQGGQVWNPATDTLSAVPYNTQNLFCSGFAALPDGRILIAGGHTANYVGIPDATIFDPVTQGWTPTGRMAFGRWYPTVTTLPDGRMLVTSGAINCQGCNADTPEIYNPATGSWTRLNNAVLPLPLYPHMFVLPDGRVLVTGSYESSQDPVVTRALNIATQTWTTIDPVPVNGGSAAMYLPGKIVTSGLGTAGGADATNVPSAATTYVLDMTQPVPAWRQTAPMQSPRDYHNLTILPDGNVLVTGGGETTGATDATTAVFEAEMWSPVTEAWTTMAAMRVPRLYHSTALLLPDGRVLVAGGGRNAGVGAPNNSTDHLNAEIFSPPYLFKGPRPTITSAPPTMSYAANVFVATPDAPAIVSVSLLRAGSVTHAINQDQRFLPLTFQQTTGGLTVQSPANANLAPPGYYMLFILDANGIPSVAKMVRLQ